MSLEPSPARASQHAAGPRRPFYRRLRYVLGALVALAIVGLVAASWVDRIGWKFFRTGEGLTHKLADLGARLTARDMAGIEKFYASDFRGAPLGLSSLKLAESRDGLRIYPFRSPGGSADRAAAVAEWRDYLAGFDSIEEAHLYVHRLESWASPTDLVASVRFELIGTPTGEARSGIDRGFFRLRLRATSEGTEIVSSELIEGNRMLSTEPQFVDVAAQAGVAFENRYYPAYLPENRDTPLAFGMLKYGPGGITAVDYDNDGFYDLFVPDGVEARLFRNRGGSFEDVTAASGLAGLDGVGVGVFADYDNDGYKDAFISRTFKPNQLWHNNGNGTFTDVTAKSKIGEDCCTTVASWGDVDNDGLLDLYVGRYLEPRKHIPTTFYARNGEPNQLYRNNGDGTFTNITEQAGVGEIGLCLGTVFGDYDNDGDADLYVVNDFGRKTLYRNDGTGRFKDVTVESGTLAYGAGMSASFGDYDNDGLLDIYAAQIRSEDSWYAEWPTVFRYMLNSWRQGVWMSDMPLYFEIFRQSGFGFVKVFQDMASGNTLLRNKGDGTFADETWEGAANPPGWFWGSGFADFDNDGWQDIYAANGWVYNKRGTEIELQFLNNVVTKQDEYKTGAFFDPRNFGEMSWHGWERNRHLRSKGKGPDGRVRFEEIGHPAGSDLILNSRGTAFADFWNRGVLDIAVAASTDRHALLRNDVGLRHNWLAVELTGAAGKLPKGSNRDAVGARVTIVRGGERQLREVALGDGYASQNSLRLYFGLGGERGGEAPVLEEVIVKWPRSGQEQRFEKVPANQIIAIEEGAEAWVKKAYGGGV
ncbi:MAG: CRTAC1 family protein [Vicinamibacteria bacterium]